MRRFLILLFMVPLVLFGAFCFVLFEIVRPIWLSFINLFNR